MKKLLNKKYIIYPFAYACAIGIGLLIYVVMQNAIIVLGKLVLLLVVATC